MWDESYALSELPLKETTMQELDFIEGVLDIDKGSVILDLCCGEGRHSVGLRRRGYRVIGLDKSIILLNLARKRSRKLRLVQADMRNIPLRESSCDAVICMFTSFGFFNEEDNLRCLKSVASVLKPSGKFLLDYWNPYMAATLHGSRNWWWIDEKKVCLAEVFYDAENGKVIDQRQVIDIPSRKVDKVSRVIRLYHLTEIMNILKSINLPPIKVYGDIDWSSYELTSPRIIVVSRKYERSSPSA